MLSRLMGRHPRAVRGRGDRVARCVWWDCRLPGWGRVVLTEPQTPVPGEAAALPDPRGAAPGPLA
jgi:hypothetical protein